MAPSTVVLNIVTSEILHPFLHQRITDTDETVKTILAGPLNRTACTVVTAQLACKAEFSTIITLQNYSDRCSNYLSLLTTE